LFRQQDAPRHADFGAGDARLGGAQFARFANRPMTVEPLAPWIDSQRLDGVQFFPDGRLRNDRVQGRTW